MELIGLIFIILVVWLLWFHPLIFYGAVAFFVTLWLLDLTLARLYALLTYDLKRLFTKRD